MNSAASPSHLVLIPSYNTGPIVYRVVEDARKFWNPVWVVVDGSTDGTGAKLAAMAASDSGLRVMVLPRNLGKGAAVLHGMEEAIALGFSHALTMDADGQHPAYLIPLFMQRSTENPDAMILGDPIFDASAPLLRLRGRKISNWWTNLETLWAGVHDSLFGFRVYPMAPLSAIMKRQRWMRRFDFDVEAAVRLVWKGAPCVNVPSPVRYLSLEDGGVSHFAYVRDNILLTWMHARLMLEFLLRLPVLLVHRLKSL